jgi:hypothetical protein
MSISAMKEALEALEDAEELLSAEGYSTAFQKEAITALRQAIAEAEKQPVHASDISQEHVDETAKGKHDLWIAAACLKSTVESAIKAGDWIVDGACDPTRDLAYLADCLANPKREWVGLTDLARVGEVGVWGKEKNT